MIAYQSFRTLANGGILPVKKLRSKNLTNGQTSEATSSKLVITYKLTKLVNNVSVVGIVPESAFVPNDLHDQRQFGATDCLFCINYK
jgi:hypothetical protein